MRKLVRFSISLEQDILDEFDRKIKSEKCLNRSKTIATLINKYLIEKKTISGKKVAGAISLVYDHHKRMIVDNLTSIQHDCHHIIVSSQHVHLTHNICFEIIVVKGKGKEIEYLFNKLKKVNGIINSYLTVASTA